MIHALPFRFYIANTAAYLLQGLGIGQEQFLTQIHISRKLQERTQGAYSEGFAFVIGWFSGRGNEDGHFKRHTWRTPTGPLSGVCVHTGAHAPCAIVHNFRPSLSLL